LALDFSWQDATGQFELNFECNDGWATADKAYILQVFSEIHCKEIRIECLSCEAYMIREICYCVFCAGLNE
jgi:hypothetical protein